MNIISRVLASRIFQELLYTNQANTSKSLNKQFAEVKDILLKKILKNVLKNEK